MDNSNVAIKTTCLKEFEHDGIDIVYKKLIEEVALTYNIMRCKVANLKHKSAKL